MPQTDTNIWERLKRALVPADGTNLDGPWTLLINPAGNRNLGILHRSAIAAVDKVAVPGTLTLTAATKAGSTLANVAYHVDVSAGNTWGPTGPGTEPGTITPTANQVVNVAWAQVAGATYYDIFIGIAVGGLWVGRVTEAQRAAGNFIISAVGTVSVGTSAAGSIDLGIVGTGLASNVAPFANNNAYTPATPTAVNCQGHSRAHVIIEFSVTDLRSLPTLVIVPFLANQVKGADWHQGKLQTVSLLSANGQCLQQDFEIDVDGSTGLVILVDAITGQGAAASIWVELA